MHQVHLFIGNSNIVEIAGLRNAVTHAFVNAASATFSVLRNGVAISGGNNVSMPYVVGSNGRYVGVLPETADLTERVVEVRITVDAGSSADALWRIHVRPKHRDF